MVYRGYDPTLDREVAVKVPHPGSLDSERAKVRFLREPKAAANLRHPNIVPVHDAGIDGDTYYIASAFIEGQTLKDATHEKRLDSKESTRIVRALGEALAYAHGRKVVHRDVKPANVMLDADGAPLLMDFGLARVADSASEATMDGTVLGTPAYMAPEQARGELEQVGPWSDQYSLGVTLYELLCGQTPFSGPPSLVITLVRTQEPTAPRSIDATISKDLETICQKAMSKDPEHRYASCGEMADDLRRWQEGEPIQARRLSMPERTVRWVRRNPLMAILVEIVIVITLFAFIAVTWQWQAAVTAQRETIAAERERNLAQIDGLVHADIQQVSFIIENLEPIWDDVGSHIKDRLKETELPDGERLRLALAFVGEDRDQARYLYSYLLTAEPLEFPVVRDALSPFAAKLSTPLWKIASDEQAEQAVRFRAACALAGFAPKIDQAKWSSISGHTATVLASQNPLVVGTWMEALRPVRSVLSPSLLEISRDANRTESERSLAATILCDYAIDQPDVLVGLLLDGDRQQFAMAMPKLQTHAAEAIPQLELPFSQPVGADATEAQRETTASRQANAAIALLHLGQNQRIWALFQHRPDPTARSFLVQRAASLGVDPQTLIARIDIEQDVSARRALILALGQYGKGELSASDRQGLIPKLLAMYQDEPDPGMHGSAEWLLRQWQQQDKLQDIDGQLATGKPENDRQWYINHQGQTMVLVQGPVEFMMGSPESETERDSDETQHRRQIRRNFAIAAKEVTVEQYERFLKANPDVARISAEDRERYYPDSDCPHGAITWYEAAAYCNWLSNGEGIPGTEWCYVPKDGKYAEGMSVASDYLQRTGYRLPTEAEWEYACRSGSETARYFGVGKELLSGYAWYQENANERAWPVCDPKPNDLGLFDMLGNALEWCQDGRWDYPYDPAKEGNSGVEDRIIRVLRGGSFNNQARNVRSALRFGYQPYLRDNGVGFRLARTYD